jgi:hypothetical protein
MNEQLDLIDKKNWTLENFEQIIRNLGLIADQDSKDGLELFIKNVVQPAHITLFLKVMFIGYLRKLKKEKTS